MIVITNASPLIALSQAEVLPLLESLFGQVLVPGSVYQETVTGCRIAKQKEAIEAGLQRFFVVERPCQRRRYSRNLGAGEAGVLDLALDKGANLLLLDDKKARNEAYSLGLQCAFTSDVLRFAALQGLVDFQGCVIKLRKANIYIPVDQ